jgi:CHAD domain-containing protein
MKLVRAGLRLFREVLGEIVYRHLNQVVRNAARPLTGIRDAKVLGKTLDTLCMHSDQSTQCAPLRQALQHEWRSKRDQLSSEVLKRTSARLLRVEQPIRRLPAARLEDLQIDVAVKRAYRKARKAFHASEQSHDDEHLHEWRKQVKYYFHQLQLLQHEGFRKFDAVIKRAHELADLLGDDHDLALLHQRILSDATHTHESSNAIGTLIKDLTRQRTKLQRKARRLGQKLYADKPKHVAERIRKQLKK